MADPGPGRRAENKKKTTSVGYAFLHSTIDDHSRVVYSEILTDEKKETATAFWHRANTYYESLGITVKRVLSDNGSCYRSTLFNIALGDIAHKYTRLYRPQTNGKIERFHRTLAFEWAYAHHYNSDAARAATYDAWIHSYNHHRPHTGISAANHPSTAYTTSMGRTARRSSKQWRRTAGAPHQSAPSPRRCNCPRR